MHAWVQQNHDGLPQKAGLPQAAVNEIHGALHAPDNPVIPMGGSLRADLYEDLLDCEARAELVLAVGTSLAGMNADRIVQACADRACAARGRGPPGAVIICVASTSKLPHILYDLRYPTGICVRKIQPRKGAFSKKARFALTC